MGFILGIHRDTGFAWAVSDVPMEPFLTDRKESHQRLLRTQCPLSNLSLEMLHGTRHMNHHDGFGKGLRGKLEGCQKQQSSPAM